MNTWKYDTSKDIHDIYDDDLIVYPNPAKNKIYFSGLLPSEFTFNIFNVLGEKIYSSANENTPANIPNCKSTERQVDLPTLQTGIYFLQIHTKE